MRPIICIEYDKSGLAGWVEYIRSQSYFACQVGHHVGVLEWLSNANVTAILKLFGIQIAGLEEGRSQAGCHGFKIWFINQSFFWVFAPLALL